MLGMTKQPNTTRICASCRERFAEERERVETCWTDQAYFDRWFDQKLTYYAGVKFPDKEQEDLTTEERLKRRNKLIGRNTEETE